MTDDHKPDPNLPIGTGAEPADEETVRVPAANPEAPNPAAETGAPADAGVKPPETVTPSEAEAPDALPGAAEVVSLSRDDAQIDVPTVPIRTAQPKAPVLPEPDPVPEPPPASDSSTSTGFDWRRGLRRLMHPRVTGAGALIALLVGLLGFALIVQVKSNSNSSTLENVRPDDLVRILSDLDGRKDRLGTEITSLQAQQRQLNSGAQGREAALQAAQQRADELGILAGTLPATGPGLVITLQPAAGKPIDQSLVLEAVEALRDAGGEAMQIAGASGPAVRVVASSWFVDGPDGAVIVDGQALTGALDITVIGDPQTMQTALTIPGEVDDMLKQAGGNVLVEQPGRVTVGALHATTPAKYAHPVS